MTTTLEILSNIALLPHRIIQLTQIISEKSVSAFREQRTEAINFSSKFASHFNHQITFML